MGPPRTWGGEKAMTGIQVIKQANPDKYHNVISSPSCKACVYKCRLLIKYEKLKAEVIYLEEVYHTVYQKFLAAIDHLDYHTRFHSTIHKKHSIQKPYIPVHQYDDLSQAEESF